MSDAVSEAYNNDAYPAMSHPAGHPAVMAASALLGGLKTAEVGKARILEIGCSSGHHILPIAAAFPDASFTAIDISTPAIQQARALADRAGIRNVQFHHADILSWRNEAEPFDYIIAHGFFSWVADEAKTALLQLCHDSLGENGVAMISYNTLPGWSLRMPLRDITQTLRRLPSCHDSSIAALDLLGSAMRGTDSAYGKYLQAIIRDARAKGEQQLKFDDLAPVVDPCYFSQFVHWCRQAGLKYLHESNLALGSPALLPEGAAPVLQELRADPLLQQQLADFFTGRTFRTSLVCRHNAALQTPDFQTLMRLCVEVLVPLPETGNAVTDRVCDALRATQPQCVSIASWIDQVDSCSPEQAVSVILQLAQLGMVRLRSTPVTFSELIPEKPALSAWNREFLNQQNPVVDAFHLPCQFAADDRAILQSCDGSRSFAEIIASCKNSGQIDAAHALFLHLSRRGLLL
jgi:SAM-dependent methyltransferase